MGLRPPVLYILKVRADFLEFLPAFVRGVHSARINSQQTALQFMHAVEVSGEPTFENFSKVLVLLECTVYNTRRADSRNSRKSSCYLNCLYTLNVELTFQDF